jgi:hypothetical protein
MATQTQTQAYYINTNNQNTPRRFKGGPEQPLFVEGSAQTWAIGDFIYQNGTSNLQICTVNGSSQMTSQVGGQAKVKASGVTGASVHFPIVRPDDEFVMNVYHSTPALAITALTQIGTPRALVRINGIWMVDIENAVEGSANSLARVLVTDIPPLTLANGTVNAVGDTYGFVKISFLPLSLALTGTVAATRILQFAT